jgi:rhodanese-related sulfurtransferase
MDGRTFSAEQTLTRAMDTEMISAEQLRLLSEADIPSVVSLDIRSDMEIMEGIIPRSTLFPCDHDQVDRKNTAIFSRCFHEHFKPENFDSDNQYILICRTGHRTAIALDVMLRHGLQCCELLGGIVEWKRLGFPLVKAPSG